MDKHRLLHVVNVVSHHMTFAMKSNARNVFDIPSMHSFDGVLEDGAEVLRVRPGSRGVLPEPQVYVDLKLDCEVSCDNAPPAGSPNPAAGQPVIATLYTPRNHIRDVVFPKLEPFLV